MIVLPETKTLTLFLIKVLVTSADWLTTAFLENWSHTVNGFILNSCWWGFAFSCVCQALQIRSCDPQSETCRALQRCQMCAVAHLRV